MCVRVCVCARARAYVSIGACVCVCVCGCVHYVSVLNVLLTLCVYTRYMSFLLNVMLLAVVDNVQFAAAPNHLRDHRNIICSSSSSSSSSSKSRFL